jgi:dihydroorotate dehydrogenase (fumarate)
MYTINISCPNTYGGEPYTTPQSLDALLAGIDALKLKRPIFVKLPIDKTWRETNTLLKTAASHNVQGITIGNLRKDRSKAVLLDPLPATVKGNLSGRPCWEPSNELLAKAYRDYHDRFVFIGVGGVFSAQDAYTKIKLGASLVELITGMIFQGPSSIGIINKELASLLERDGYTSVAQAVGADIRKKG